MHLPEQLLINEVQLLLAEKRTYYALLRTGIAIIALPLTVIAFLLATNEYHGIFNNSWIAGVAILMIMCISVLGIYLTQWSWNKIRQVDKYIERIRKENKRLAEIVL